MIRRPYRHQRARSQFTPNQAPPARAISVTLTINATKLRIVTDSPVVVSAIPLGITRQAAGAGPQLAPTAVTAVDAQTVDVTYAASLVVTDIITIPANVAEIRGTAGGYLASAKKTF
jgi:Na+/serine symporter